jgi:hypothetical protein
VKSFQPGFQRGKINTTQNLLDDIDNLHALAAMMKPEMAAESNRYYDDIDLDGDGMVFIFQHETALVDGIGWHAC